MAARRAAARQSLPIVPPDEFRGGGPGMVAVGKVVENGAAVSDVVVEFFSRPLVRDIWKADTMRGRVPLVRSVSDDDGLVYLPEGRRGTYFVDAVGPLHHSVGEVRITHPRLTEPNLPAPNGIEQAGPHRDPSGPGRDSPRRRSGWRVSADVRRPCRGSGGGHSRCSHDP